MPVTSLYDDYAHTVCGVGIATHIPPQGWHSNQHSSLEAQCDSVLETKLLAFSVERVRCVSTQQLMQSNGNAVKVIISRHTGIYFK